MEWPRPLLRYVSWWIRGDRLGEHALEVLRWEILQPRRLRRLLVTEHADFLANKFERAVARCPETVSLGEFGIVQKLAENPLLRDRRALNCLVRYASREFLNASESEFR